MMYSCPNPQICGVRAHRDAKNCRALQSRDITTKGGESSQSLSTPSLSSESQQESMWDYLEHPIMTTEQVEAYYGIPAGGDYELRRNSDVLDTNAMSIGDFSERLLGYTYDVIVEWSERHQNMKLSLLRSDGEDEHIQDFMSIRGYNEDGSIQSIELNGQELRILEDGSLGQFSHNDHIVGYVPPTTVSKMFEIIQLYKENCQPGAPVYYRDGKFMDEWIPKQLPYGPSTFYRK